MKRASNAFSVLQAIAATVALATILWSLGLPSFRFADAANVTSFSDTLTSTAPGVVSNHTIEFVTPSGIGDDAVITVTFPAGFDLSAIGPEDVALYDGQALAYELPATWLVSTTSNTVVITSQGTFPIATGATTTIYIGLNADGDGQTPDGQIVNPGSVGSYEIDVYIDNSANAFDDDLGTTEVAIISEVTVSASVDTQFTFTVSGVAAGQTVNGTTTTGSSSAIAIPFGELLAGVASTAAQDLTVNTNSSNGFVVTVMADGQLVTANGADIDGFRNVNYETTSQQWEGPTPVLGDEWTYGHWGLTSDDQTLGSDFATDLYDVGNDGQNYVSASTTPVEVFRHDGPADGSGQGQGTTRVGYTVQVSALQEAATDYEATLTYVATPVF
jgi:hypothetical protein